MAYILCMFVSFLYINITFTSLYSLYVNGLYSIVASDAIK